MLRSSRPAAHVVQPAELGSGWQTQYVPVRMVRSRCAPSTGWCSATRAIACRSARVTWPEHARSRTLRPACRALLEERAPGTVTQTINDADTFFGVELPGLAAWTFGADQAAAIDCPVLSVLGTETQPLWVDVADFLRRSLPNVEDCPIDGVGHLLHAVRPQPVALAMAEFLGRHAMAYA